MREISQELESWQLNTIQFGFQHYNWQQESEPGGEDASLRPPEAMVESQLLPLRKAHSAEVLFSGKRPKLGFLYKMSQY